MTGVLLFLFCRTLRMMGVIKPYGTGASPAPQTAAIDGNRRRYLVSG